MCKVLYLTQALEKLQFHPSNGCTQIAIMFEKNKGKAT